MPHPNMPRIQVNYLSSKELKTIRKMLKDCANERVYCPNVVESLKLIEGALNAINQK